MAMTLRLSDHDEQLLAVLAEGVSKHEATVRAIRAAADRRVHRAKVRQASGAQRDKYTDLLDRLGR